MYLQNIENVSNEQFVAIKYDCDGGFKRCGKEWKLRFGYSMINFRKNKGTHICRQCQPQTNDSMDNLTPVEKTKRTNLERRGVTCSLNTPEHIAARKQKMFGTQEAIDARTEKTKQTNLERRGVEHHMQTEETKQKVLETSRRNYGTDHPMQNEEVKEGARQTVQERYGVDCVLSLPEVQLKGKKTMLERYGVEYYNQLPEMKEYLRQNCTIWLADSYEAGGHNAGKPLSEETKKKMRDRVIELILDGKWTAGYKKTLRGYYTSAGKCKREVSFFRSGFELLYHHYLDVINENVEWYDYEPFKIDYIKADETIHAYIPDFLVKYKGLDTLFIVEIKADYLHDSIETKQKYEAAREFVANTINMEYSILLKEDIYKLGLDVNVIKKLSNVSILNDIK